MGLVVLGLSHKTAPVEIREKFAIPADAISNTAELVRAAGFTESFILSTCNRVELYALGDDPLEIGKLRQVMAAMGSARVRKLDKHLYDLRGGEAIRHLFRVAASLDSMVIGEPQILGQLKTAFDTCRGAGVTGPTLNRACERAFSVAKRVRTETGIGRSSVSISSVAVDLAREIFGDLRTCTVALVGAGEMGELAARNLVQGGVASLIVANRSLDRARALAESLGGHPRELDELPGLLVEADILVTSTGARGYLIEKRAVKKAMRARKYRPLFLIDIAVPRNIDPSANSLENVYVYDVDDLQGIANENQASREREAEQAEAMVESEAQRFLRDLAGQSVKPTIVALRRKAAAIKSAELERASRALGALDPKQKKAVEMLADGVVNKMLHDVMMTLKRSASEDDAAVLLDAARRLFKLDDDREDQ